MKKSIKAFIATLCLVASMAVTSMAGTWGQDATGWYYLNDNGARSFGWQWIDGNNDGISECYYFNEAGYCLMNTVTPDGMTVDATGAWTMNGVVQTQTVQVNTQQTSTSYMNGYQGVSSTPFDGYSIIVNTNTHKYHVPSCRKADEIYAENKGYANNEQLLISQGFTACKVCH